MPQRRSFGGYSAEEYRTFPRYIVLEAILDGVEVLVPEGFKNVEILRDALIEAASSENLMTRPPSASIELETRNDERAKFARYIKTISADDLYDVEPLHYRRKLRDEEAAVVRGALERRWKADLDCWYPLSEKPDGIDVEAFPVSSFERAVGYHQLEEMLSRRGITRVFQMQEGGCEGYEIDVAGTAPQYAVKNFDETWWTDKEVSFIIYASHESSITIGGCLLDDVRSWWPGWRDQIYTGWDQA